MEALDLVIHTLTAMAKGAALTLKFPVSSMVFGLVAGLVIAIIRISQNRLAASLAQGYVSLIRGTPLLVKMVVVYYGFPNLGISLAPTAAGIFTLTINAAVYLSESMRGEILGIGRGQWAAPHCLGLTHLQTLRHVVCPQALRLAVPSLGNTLTSLIKGTSLVSVITVTELLRSTQEVIAATFQPRKLYLTAVAIYWLLSTVLTRLQARVETRLALPFVH